MCCEQWSVYLKKMFYLRFPWKWSSRINLLANTLGNDEGKPREAKNKRKREVMEDMRESKKPGEVLLRWSQLHSKHSWLLNVTSCLHRAWETPISWNSPWWKGRARNRSAGFSPSSVSGWSKSTAGPAYVALALYAAADIARAYQFLSRHCLGTVDVFVTPP